MNRQQLAFLAAGVAFGFLLGFGVYHVQFAAPDLDADRAPSSAVAAPQGPMAPTQVGSQAGGDAGAPMVAEINALKRRLQSQPDDFEALVRLGNLHYDVQMWPQAVEYYERAVAINGNNADLLTDLGVSYRGLGQYERALEHFQRAQQVNAQHWQSLFNTVVVQGLDLKQFDRADEVLRRMEALNPPPDKLAALRQALEQARSSAGGGAS